MKPEARDQSMSRFRSDRAHVLVAVRSLDEGLDVPDAEVAITAAGSRSERQRIQRSGRVLRRGDGETRAIGITVLARGTPEEIIGYRDASLLGPKRVPHHRWPNMKIEEGLNTASSRSVPASPVSDADKLTLVDADLDALATPEALRLAEQATRPKVAQKRGRAGRVRAVGRPTATPTLGRLDFHGYLAGNPKWERSFVDSATPLVVLSGSFIQTGASWYRSDRQMERYRGCG
jgi:superfamily II DNA or RNA helicase